MRRCLFALPIVALAAAVLPTSSASAQLLASGSFRCSVETNLFLGSMLLHGPYTVTARLTLEQHLADGNTIRTASEGTFARDESGRTLQQVLRGCQRAETSAGNADTEVTVQDPKAKTTLTWYLGPRSTHVAFLRHEREFSTVVAPAPRMMPPRLETPEKVAERNETREDLGTRTIAGVQATGTRWTRVIPSGAEGNDLPITVLRETWFSQNPHMEVRNVEDDPRVGHRVWEVVSLSLSAPDASVFAPPQGYTVDEGKPLPGSAGIGAVAGSISVTSGSR